MTLSSSTPHSHNRRCTNQAPTGDEPCHPAPVASARAQPASHAASSHDPSCTHCSWLSRNASTRVVLSKPGKPAAVLSSRRLAKAARATGPRGIERMGGFLCPFFCSSATFFREPNLARRQSSSPQPWQSPRCYPVSSTHNR